MIEANVPSTSYKIHQKPFSRALIPLVASLVLGGGAFYKSFKSVYNPTYQQHQEAQQERESLLKERAGVNSISLRPEIIPADIVSQYNKSRDGALHVLDMHIAETEQKIAEFNISEIKLMKRDYALWALLGAGIMLAGGSITAGLRLRSSLRETPPIN